MFPTFAAAFMFFRDYLKRSFEVCENAEDRDRVENYLKVEISQMFDDGRVWDIHWESEPLPL